MWEGFFGRGGDAEGERARGRERGDRAREGTVGKGKERDEEDGERQGLESGRERQTDVKRMPSRLLLSDAAARCACGRVVTRAMWCCECGRYGVMDLFQLAAIVDIS